MSGSGVISFDAMIKSMSFPQFLVAFGTLWNGQKRCYEPWVPWEGVGGNPGQLDVAAMLESTRAFYTPKSRKKGISELWALYCAYVLMREPNADAKVYGASSAQTREFMEKRFQRQIEGLSAVYPEIPWPKWVITKDRADCDNGSFLNIYSSENTGAHGGDPRLTLLDEAQLYAANDFKEMMKGILPTLNGERQFAMIGTSRSGSKFNETVDGIRNNYPMVKTDVWEDDSRTEDGLYKRMGMIFLADSLDPRHRVPGWKESQIASFGGDMVSYLSQHPESIDDIFLSHEGLVISSWDTKRHVVDMDVVWKPHHEFYIFYDHGSSPAHPAVLGLLQYDPWNDFLYCFDEVFERGVELSVMAGKMTKKLVEWRRRWDDERQVIKPGVRPYGDVRGLYGIRHVDEILRDEMGLQFIMVKKRDEAAQIELTKARHFRGTGEGRRGGIAYHSRCQNIIKQISSLRYKEGKDEPEGLENDSLDMIKYACHTIHLRAPSPEPTWEELNRARTAAWAAAARAQNPRAAAAVDPAVTLEEAMNRSLRAG